MADNHDVVDHDVDGLFVREVSPATQQRRDCPLVFIHGGFHGWWTWERWQPFFAELGWRTYALSLPGHTGSRKVPDPEFAALDLTDYADAVTRTLDWLHEPAILVGHSMGGIVAQLVAQVTPPSALVLVASGRTRRGEKFRPDVPLGQPITISREEARQNFFHVIGDEEFDRVYRRLCPESPAALNDLADSGAFDAPRFECPVLVLTAEHDREHVSELADHATRSYQATRAVVADAGHDLMLDPRWLDAATYLHGWLVTHVSSAAVPTVRVEVRD
jgi:pimeloyl-ACP methyl ester carboxylesterase